MTAGDVDTPVRVTVSSGSYRVDLVLPGAVPVAELLPALARSVGLLDPTAAHGGYRLVTAGGDVLALGPGLAAQGVQDGCFLAITARTTEPAPRVYDDVVEAVADVADQELDPFARSAARRTSLTAAMLGLGLGAAGLLLQPGSPRVAGAAGAISAALVACAIVASRIRHDREAATGMAWSATAFAAVAGLSVRGDGPVFGAPLVAAGVGAVAAGWRAFSVSNAGGSCCSRRPSSGSCWPRPGRRCGQPPSAGGGDVRRAGPGRPGGLDDSGTGARCDPDDPDDRGAVQCRARRRDRAPTDRPAPVGRRCPGGTRDRGRTDVRSRAAADGDRAARGVPRCLRQPDRGRLECDRDAAGRTASQRLAGPGRPDVGAGGLVSSGVALLVLHPGWRPVVVGLLAATGVVVVLVAGMPARSVRRQQSTALAETVAVLSLAPLLVLAVDAVPTAI